MSADNWAVCPSCLAAVNRLKQELLAATADAYGKVPPDDYLKMLRDAERPVDIGETLREDYGIGIDETGEFSVSYRGRCTDCALAYEYKFAQMVELPKPFSATKGATKRRAERKRT